MIDRLGTVAAFASWTALAFWAGWELRKRWATALVFRFVRQRTKAVSEAYMDAQDRRLRRQAKAKGYQA